MGASSQNPDGKSAAAVDPFSPRLRRIVLCADDYGLAPGVNAAIRQLLTRGRLNATSVMTVAPSCGPAETAALARLRDADPRLAIGLHVTLTAPFEPLSRGFAPLGADGRFLPIAPLLARSYLRPFDRAALTDEIAAQIAAFVTAFGRPPDFVDGHQHVQLLPRVRDVVLEATRRANPNAWVRQCGPAEALNPARLLDPKGLLLSQLSRAFRSRAQSLGVPTNPAFAGTYTFRAGASYPDIFAGFLRGLPNGAVIMCHPGRVDPELERLDPVTTLREREFAFLAGDAFPALLAQHGLTLDGAQAA